MTFIQHNTVVENHNTILFTNTLKENNETKKISYGKLLLHPTVLTLKDITQKRFRSSYIIISPSKLNEYHVMLLILTYYLGRRVCCIRFYSILFFFPRKREVEIIGPATMKEKRANRAAIFSFLTEQPSPNMLGLH